MLLQILDILSPALTEPSFANMLVIFAGWVLTPMRRAVTETLVQTRVSGHRHHSAFHRFFSLARWSPDALGKCVFAAVRQWAGPSLRIAIDDTLAPKKGANVYGLGCHLNAARSSRRFKVFSFGHCCVVLAVLVQVPFSNRCWALPVLFRLYRNKSMSPKSEYAKKTQLAREMLGILLGWVPEETVLLAADSGFCCHEVLRDQPKRLVVFGSMNLTAALFDPPAQPKKRGVGRPRKLGQRLPALPGRDVRRHEPIPWDVLPRRQLDRSRPDRRPFEARQQLRARRVAEDSVRLPPPSARDTMATGRDMTTPSSSARRTACTQRLGPTTPSR